MRSSCARRTARLAARCDRATFATLYPLTPEALIDGLSTRADCLGGQLYIQDTVLCPNAACGNGIVEPGENCDDGNTNDGDACPSNCWLQCSRLRRGAVTCTLQRDTSSATRRRLLVGMVDYTMLLGLTFLLIVEAAPFARAEQRHLGMRLNFLHSLVYARLEDRRAANRVFVLQHIARREGALPTDRRVAVAPAP
jgi:cysteine-rich repeat protein